MSGALCIHCAEGLLYRSGSPAGRKGWRHAQEPTSWDHDPLPSDFRSGKDERAREQTEQEIRKSIYFTPVSTFAPKPPAVFHDRRV